MRAHIVTKLEREPSFGFQRFAEQVRWGDVA